MAYAEGVPDLGCHRAGALGCRGNRGVGVVMDRWTEYARNELSDMTRKWMEFRRNRFMWNEARPLPYQEAKLLLVEVEDMERVLREAVEKEEAA